MDLRIKKTKLALRAALFTLLQKKPITKISVASLCRQAKINRRTFYIHYEKITDIFEEYEFYLSQQVQQTLSTPTPNPQRIVLLFDHILMSNFDGFRALCLNDKHHVLVNDLKDMLFQAMTTSLIPGTPTGPQQLILQYISTGTVDNYVYWFAHPKDISYSQVTQTNERLLHANLQLL
ncbi:TetR/AcrR family transcriptional regulator [Furfurilactobacillus cerevisiae]|uniref:TetR/AcrR family transcriptional regulator n=1 Tax=Furfurilactobacillus rossiae TaxID=231049 RepID=UPI003B9853CF